MKNKRFLNSILCSIVITVIVSTPPLVQAHTLPGSIVIHITETGFSPTTVEIEAGKTVIFENIGTLPHWPASNIHPTHDIYPELDPTKAMEPGSSWRFRFDKPGVWQFHDHLDATKTGAITVASTGNSKANSRLSKRKIGFVERTRLYVAKLEAKLFPQFLSSKAKKLNIHEVAKDELAAFYWLSLLGPEKMMVELLEDSGGGSLIDCHQQAHIIGRIAYELHKAKAFEQGNASCHSGYYHGAMEMFLREKGTINLARDITEVCKVFPTSFGQFECLHGVGHGVTAYLNYDLPQALAECKKLPDSFAQSSCYGGTFMENIVTAQGQGANPAHETKWANQDPHFPCNQLEGQAVLYQCYQMQTSWMLTLMNYDFLKVGSECHKAPKDIVAVCFKSLGRDIAGNTLRNAEKIVSLCPKVTDTVHYVNECFTGAVNVVVDFWGEGLKAQATDVCKLLPEANKANCYGTITGRLSGLFATAEKRRAVCETFESVHQTRCLSSF